MVLFSNLCLICNRYRYKFGIMAQIRSKTPVFSFVWREKEAELKSLTAGFRSSILGVNESHARSRAVARLLLFCSMCNIKTGTLKARFQQEAAWI